MRKVLFPIVVMSVMGLLGFTLLASAVATASLMFSSTVLPFSLICTLLSWAFLGIGFTSFINPLLQLLVSELSDPAKSLENLE